VFVADGDTGLNIIDIRDPTRPVLLARSWRGFRCVHVDGNYAYAGNAIVDIRNPGQPREVSLIPGDDIVGLQKDGNNLYALDQKGVVRIFDVSNPALPSLLGQFDPNPGTEDRLIRIQVSNGLGYICGAISGGQGSSKAIIVDVRNPSSPTFLGRYELSQEVFDVEALGDLAFCASRGSGLLVLDVSNRSRPRLIGSAVPGGFANSIRVVGNTAYLADADAGLVLADVADPFHPRQVGVTMSVGGAGDVRVSGDYAYVVGPAGLGIVDVSDRTRPVRVASLDTGFPQGLDVISNRVYVADAEVGFDIIDVANPFRPTLVANYPFGGVDVRVAWPRAYVLAYEGRVGVFDIRHAGLPTLLASTLANRDSANGLEVIDQEIIITGWEAAEVFMLEGRTNLVRSGFGPPSAAVRKEGTNFFFAAGGGGLTIAEESHVPYFTMNASARGGGSVIVSPDFGLVRSNSIVSLSAIPWPGWTLLEWFGDASGNAASNQVLITRDSCAAAVFGTRLTTSTAGGGTIIQDPVTGLFPYGSVVSLTAVPDPGNGFAYWGDELTGTTNSARLTIARANPNVFARFSPLVAGRTSLAVIIRGMGSVTSLPVGNDFAVSNQVTLRAMPEADQNFLGWSGDATESQNPLMVAMNQSRIITAHFTARPAFDLGDCATRATDTSFRLSLLGQLGATYTVDASTNLVHWVPLARLTNSAGVMQFEDPRGAESGYRFYRAAVAP
jgi:hypothetical protein